MIRYCFEKWDKNKDLLKKRLKDDLLLNKSNYEYLVKLVVEYILNQGDDEYEWDSEHITVIDNGDYQGTLLFLIPCDGYQPDETEYLMTYVGYGSCSGCDTLQRIQDDAEGKVTASQLKDYMTLCKDIVTNMIKPYNKGWGYDEVFETIELK